MFPSNTSRTSISESRSSFLPTRRFFLQSISKEQQYWREFLHKKTGRLWVYTDISNYSGVLETLSLNEKSLPHKKWAKFGFKVQKSELLLIREAWERDDAFRPGKPNWFTKKQKDLTVLHATLLPEYDRPPQGGCAAVVEAPTGRSRGPAVLVRVEWAPWRRWGTPKEIVDRLRRKKTETFQHRKKLLKCVAFDKTEIFQHRKKLLKFVAFLINSCVS